MCHVFILILLFVRFSGRYNFIIFATDIELIRTFIEKMNPKCKQLLR